MGRKFVAHPCASVSASSSNKKRKKLSSFTLSDIKEDVIHLITHECSGEVWDSFYNTLCFKMPNKSNSVRKISMMIKDSLSSDNYDAWYAKRGGSASNEPTTKVIISDPDDWYKSISIIVEKDEQNTEKGFVFIDVEFEYSE